MSQRFLELLKLEEDTAKKIEDNWQSGNREEAKSYAREYLLQVFESGYIPFAVVPLDIFEEWARYQTERIKIEGQAITLELRDKMRDHGMTVFQKCRNWQRSQ
jgi:hypothetical protein